MAFAHAANAAVYHPRDPRGTVLHQVVSETLEAFLREDGSCRRRLPWFVERTFRDYLACGLPEHGFVRVHCSNCGHDRVVAFSCKRRGLCPSCDARRMSETAADLVEHVLPHVGVRQWVLTLPYALRFRLAYDRTLLTPVLGAFLRSVFALQGRRARQLYGVRNPKCGSVTVIQRFGGSINLNVHLHALLLEGVYCVPPESDRVRFLELTRPTGEDIVAVLTDTASRIARELERRVSSNIAGIGDNENEVASDAPASDVVLAQLYSDSVQAIVPGGERAGQPTVRVRAGADSTVGRGSGQRDSLCAVAHGLSLHAGVYVGATDRERLERVCRYIARPALACDRLRRLDDGRVRYELRNPWRDGTTHVIFESEEFLARLASLVPPPRQHQVRYHGILAPAAAWRDHVVPDAKAPARGSPSKQTTETSGMTARPPRRSWAEMLRRVFAIDALRCPLCGARTRIRAADLNNPADRALLSAVVPAARPPPLCRPATAHRSPRS